MSVRSTVFVHERNILGKVLKNWTKGTYVEKKKDDTGSIFKLITNYFQISMGILSIGL